MEYKNTIYPGKISDSSKIINFINDKSKELGIDIIGFGSIETFKKYVNKFFKDNKYFKPEELFPECKTVISTGLSYNYDWNNISNESIGYIARYTTANFYKILSSKLQKLGKAIKEYLGYNKSNKDFFRVFVNSKINDKLSAYISGLGYYAKNSLIIIKDKGCKYVLGELLLSIKLPSNKENDTNCNECKFCINACPTGALTGDGSLKKDLCIQHLSSQLNWPEFINKKSFLKIWGVRFFGCTYCIDICPYNKNNFKIYNKDQELIGFVGTSFDIMNVLKFSKGDYKEFFRNNQISAGWIPVSALARNCLAALYNLSREDLIEEYLEKIDTYNWDESEKDFLKKFCFFLLNNKGN